MLARRYLNPRRALLSSFTLISLIGVLLGVLVLIVVMAVYAGLERDVKSRLLGFTPHILARQNALTDDPRDWRDVAEIARKLPGVEAVTPHISDTVMLWFAGEQQPIYFLGIDTTDPAQVSGIDEMLDHVGHPESTADMGLDDRVVLSSQVASQMGIRVGDTVQFYSARNFDEVIDAYQASEQALLRDQATAQWASLKQQLQPLWVSGAARSLPIAVVESAYQELLALHQLTERSLEIEALEEILTTLEAAPRNEAETAYRFSPEQAQTINQAVAFLDESTAEEIDAQMFKQLKRIVLPKEAVVAGIYQASQMVMTPQAFVPLPLAQTLAGLDDGIHGLSLRLSDAYAAERFKAAYDTALGSAWGMTTWGELHAPFFQLINQQRVMMYFALSFIVLVSSFSMMAVMFTVTMQKRREIGVMKALGAAPGQIVRVFLYQGMILGVIGAILGVVLGRLAIHYRGGVQVVMRGLGFDPFSESFMGFSVLPAYNNPTEQLVIACIAFVLCSIAALVPAFFAARSDAAKSLRNL